MSILSRIEAFFIGPVWNFIKPFITNMEAQGGHILIAAAEAGVAAGFAAAGGGEVAMAAALQAFEAQVVANGIPFIQSQARALIEVALQNYKITAPVQGSLPLEPAAPPAA